MTEQEFKQTLAKYVTDEKAFWAMSAKQQDDYKFNNELVEVEDMTAYFENRVSSLHWNFDKCQSNLQEYIWEVN